jgi:hypothetical protein
VAFCTASTSITPLNAGGSLGIDTVECCGLPAPKQYYVLLIMQKSKWRLKPED